jgi:hypothetical protein
MKNAKTFLKDLYEIDPSLQEHEAELLPMIEQLLKADPGMAPDAEFVAALQVSLREHAAALSTGGQRSSLWNNLLYTLGGMATATAAFVIAFASWQGALPEAKNLAGAPPAAPAAAPLFAYEVEQAGPEAFGSLNTVAADPTAASRSQSGGGGGMGGGGVAAAMPMAANDAKMIAPWPMTQYKYVYEGDLPALQSQVDVYKSSRSTTKLPLAGIIGNFKLGTIDLDSFGGMNVQSINLYQDTPFGYQIYVDLQNAQVSLNAQWDQWPMGQCKDDACFAREQVKIGDVLSDERVIEIATNFLKQHGIDLSHYGPAVADQQWRVDYERQADKSTAYIPDAQRVIFPLVIDGETVYGQGGMPYGLSVGVNVKHEKVSDIYGMGDRTYKKSSYAGVTDEAALKKFIENVDNYGYPMPFLREDGSKAEPATATVTLGDPTVEYVTYYDYTTGVNSELLVPALVFPVKSIAGDKTYFYRQNVVVPLAKQMFDEQNTNRPMPIEDGPAIMPAETAPTPPEAPTPTPKG